MSTAQRSNNTLRLREIARQMRNKEDERREPQDTLSEITVEYELPKESIQSKAATKWAGAPSWARGIVLVILTIAASSTAIIAIIQAF